jgi:hypothetical protein
VTVVGEQATDGDTQGGVVSHRSAQEGDGRSGGEIGQDLGEGNAGVVINGDIKVLSSAVQLAAVASIGTNHHAREASQLLDIEVEEIARSRVLVANQRHSRLQIAHSVRTQAGRIRLTAARLRPVLLAMWKPVKRWRRSCSTCCANASPVRRGER